MGQNDTCSLEKLIDGVWEPRAIRYQHLTMAEKRALDQGETIAKDSAPLRRRDWADRQALRVALNRG